MKIKLSALILLGLNLSFGSVAMDNSDNKELESAYHSIARAFFPGIHELVAECAVNWTDNRIISLEDRTAIEEGYLKHATRVFSGNDAPTLKKEFQAMADYHNVTPAVLIKVFGCARWYTGISSDGNLFVKANLVMAQFTPRMVNKFYTNIDAIREGFAGDATTRESKIENIISHINILESMRNLGLQSEAELAQQHDAIIDYILFFKDNERKLALDFAILAAQSSLEIVKEFVPPTGLEIVGIYAVACWHKVTSWL